MTAPDLPTWELAPDGDGEPTLWHDGWAVLRRSDMATPRRYQELLFDLLTRVLAPDEATIERLARVLYETRAAALSARLGVHARSTPAAWSASGRIRYLDEARAVLAALTGTSAQARHTADGATGGGEDG